jgi:hypothetical protein
VRFTSTLVLRVFAVVGAAVVVRAAAVDAAAPSVATPSVATPSVATPSVATQSVATPSVAAHADQGAVADDDLADAAARTDAPAVTPAVTPADVRAARALLVGTDDVVVPAAPAELVPALRVIAQDVAAPRLERVRALRLWAAAATTADDAEVEGALVGLQEQTADRELRVQAAWARVERARVRDRRGSAGTTPSTDAVLAVGRGLLASSWTELREVGVLALWRSCSLAARAAVTERTIKETDATLAAVMQARLRRWPTRTDCARDSGRPSR